MNGPINLLLDTNAVVAFLQGDLIVRRLIASSSAVAISVVSVIEFRVGVQASENDAARFALSLERMNVMSLDYSNITLVDRIIFMRQTYRLKLPDAIIAATAYERGDTLVTRDHQFGRVAGLQVEGF